jgi:hypothetical protein
VREKGGEKSRRMLLRCTMNEIGGSVGMLRAVLSDRFLVYDNLDVLGLALKAVKKFNDERGLNIEVDKLDLSDERMYVRFIVPGIEMEARNALKNYVDPDGGKNGGLGVSNGIVTGFVLSNSEVGMGSLMVAPRLKILACANGMVWNEEAFKRVHLGGKMEEGEKVWSDETKRANINLIESQLSDMIEKYCSEDFLGEKVSEIIEMSERELNYPVEAVKNIGGSIGLNEDELDGVLNYFVSQKSGNNVFGIAQALTTQAHHSSPERRMELETAATGLMELIDGCDVKKEKVDKN